MNISAIILAGGVGSRLGGITSSVPKPMIPINGKPFIEWIIKELRNQGIKKIIISTGYKADIIEQYFCDGEKFGVSISYSQERERLGTAGAIKLALNQIEDEFFFVLNGDSFCFFELKKIFNTYAKKKSSGVLWAVEVPSDNRFGALKIINKKIEKFDEKPELILGEKMYINAGIYLLGRDVFELLPKNKQLSLEIDVLPNLVKKGLHAEYNNKSEFIDIGTPESLKMASEYMKNLI